MHIHRKYLGETCDKGPETGFDEQKLFHAKRPQTRLEMRVEAEEPFVFKYLSGMWLSLCMVNTFLNIGMWFLCFYVFLLYTMSSKWLSNPLDGRYWHLGAWTDAAKWLMVEILDLSVAIPLKHFVTICAME